MEYITYENRHNPHIAIHKENCNHLRKHGGVGIGEYKDFDTLEAARRYAENTGLPVILCSSCNPDK